MLLRHLAGSLVLLQSLAAGFVLPPHYFQKEPITRRQISPAEVMQEMMAGQTSGRTVIYGPGSPEYVNATERWNTLEVPDIEMVIEVSREEDIAKIVKVCNRLSIKYLAVNRGHALCIDTMKKFKGVQIDLKQLTDITIQPGKKTAILQGGTYGREVMQTLWNQGYVTPTGAHECVGYMGPLLGGGHGRLEGMYGLVSDNVVNLNVVLADGSTIKVNSKSHSDLLWAMKGAGHNFGIVTSAEVKIFPREVDTWHYHNYYWSGDKLEEVMEKLNAFHGEGTTPVKMGVNFGSVSINPKYSNTSAVLWWTFAYAGSAQEAEKLLQPFNEIESLDQESGDIPYPQIAVAQGTSFISGGCKPTPKAFDHALLKRYDVAVERKIYDLFNRNIAKYPDLAKSGALITYEGYSTKAVEEFADDSSAYAHRHEYHIVYFVTSAAKTSPHFKAAMKWAKDTADLWNTGRKPAKYLNYATGTETLQSVYGSEPWRLQKLRHLKGQYDPHNRFAYYMPVIAPRK